MVSKETLQQHSNAKVRNAATSDNGLVYTPHRMPLTAKSVELYKAILVVTEIQRYGKSQVTSHSKIAWKKVQSLVKDIWISSTNMKFSGWYGSSIITEDATKIHANTMSWLIARLLLVCLKAWVHLGEFMTVKTKKNFAPWTSFATKSGSLTLRKCWSPDLRKKRRSWIGINRAWCLGNMLKLKEYENCKQKHHDMISEAQMVHQPKSDGWNLISRVLVIKVAPTFQDVHLLHIYIYYLFPTNYTSQP